VCAEMPSVLSKQNGACLWTYRAKGVTVNDLVAQPEGIVCWTSEFSITLLSYKVQSIERRMRVR
jgi:hypothetical protein